MLLNEGEALGRTYTVERFLGAGAFAEVYRVKHRFLGRQALKVFKRSGMSREDIHEMLGEAILLSRIRHPNLSTALFWCQAQTLRPTICATIT